MVKHTGPLFRFDDARSYSQAGLLVCLAAQNPVVIIPQTKLELFGLGIDLLANSLHIREIHGGACDGTKLAGGYQPFVYGREPVGEQA